MPQPSIQEQIVALEALAVMDAELGELTSQLESKREALAGKKQRLGEFEERIQTSQSSADEMERMKSDLVHELRQMSQQVDKSREKMARCRTEREANAVQRELEELRKLYRDRELEVEKLNALVEQARTEIDTTAAQRAELLAELGSSEGDLMQSLSELEAQITERDRARGAVAQKLPNPLLRRYDMVRKRRGTGVSHTGDGTCSGCHLAMPPQQFQILMRRAQLDTCPHCSRIIYFKPPEPAASLSNDGA